MRGPVMHRGRILVACAFLLLVSGAAWGEELEAFSFRDAREIALGGRHAALSGGAEAFLANPASLGAARPEFSAARLGLVASGPVFDLANLALGAEGDIVAALSSLLAKYDYKLYAGFELSGPLAFGYVGEGLGFGLYNRTSLKVNAASIASVTLRAREDVLIAGGYAYRQALGGGHALDLGLLAKGFVRAELGITTTLPGLEAILANPLALLGEPVDLTTGIGLDAGLRWNWNEVLAAGLVCRDVYSPALVATFACLDTIGGTASATRSARIAPDLAFGLAWSPPLRRLGRYLDGISLALDYGDMLDLARPVPRNALLNLGIGLEVRALDILAFRIGLSEALLAAGLSFDLGALRLCAAAWGDELGIEPGDRPVYNLLVSFDFVY